MVVRSVEEDVARFKTLRLYITSVVILCISPLRKRLVRSSPVSQNRCHLAAPQTFKRSTRGLISGRQMESLDDQYFMLQS